MMKPIGDMVVECLKNISTCSCVSETGGKYLPDELPNIYPGNIRPKSSRGRGNEVLAAMSPGPAVAAGARKWTPRKSVRRAWRICLALAMTAAALLAASAVWDYLSPMYWR